MEGLAYLGQQMKHLAATNPILAVAVPGEGPPADAGDEAGPETARTKAEILEYLKASFAAARPTRRCRSSGHVSASPTSGARRSLVHYPLQVESSRARS
jgi:hypothetical protein